MAFAPQYGNFASGLAQGATQGLESQFLEPEQERRKLRLQLALESSKIEAQLQAKAQEQQMFGLSPQQFGGLAGMITGKQPDQGQMGKLSGAFQGQNIPQDVLGPSFQAMGQGMRAQAISNKPVHVVSKPDHNNLVAQGFQTPTTGEWVTPPQVSLEPKAQEEINKVDNMTGNAKNMVQGILDRANSILPSAPAGVPLNKLNAYWQQHGMPTNPDLKAFIDSSNALSAQYVKDTTGMAPRSMELMKMDAGAFPNTTDDAPTAAKKAQILLQTMSNKAETAHKVYDPTDFLRPQNKNQQQNNNAPQINIDAVLNHARAISAQRQGKQSGQ